jgi:transposase-like protein
VSKSNRNAPKRSKASESRYTFYEFDREFPDDAACLDWLVGFLYPDGIYCPKCERVTKHHRVKSRPSYSCQFCGRHEHPMKGTIFEGSATSLRLWFHAIFLMSSTRCGISAKQLERELGVTYKTAWRMFNKIRSMLTQADDGPLGADGPVEVDETFYGRKPRFGEVRTRKEARMWTERKAKVLGAVERGGRIHATVIPDRSAETIMPILRTKVLPASTVYTDEWRSYRGLGREGYEHTRVNHSQNVYVSGDAHVNTVEGFWGLLKGGLRGVYHGVSTEHLQAYIDEYVFRYNNRDSRGRGMLDAFLRRIVKAEPQPS